MNGHVSPDTLQPQRRRQRGAIAVEYILVCALLVLGTAFAVPVAMKLFRYAYQVSAAVITSPWPAGL